MKNVAVILSGCGFLDGAEIHESVLTLLAIENAGAKYQCFAPDKLQAEVVNHLSGKTEPTQSRNILIEAARIARGNILPIQEINPDNFDAIIFPGGFGAAKNLCSFANEGATMSVIPEVLEVAKSFADSHKPAGYICIAPAIISRVYGSGVALTIGNDQETASALEEMGAHHKNCVVEDIIVDEAHKVVSTPAYMLAQTVSEAHEGISKLVNKVIQMV